MIKRIATIESSYIRDAQINYADPNTDDEDDDCQEEQYRDFFPCHFIGVFEGVDEEDIRNKAAAKEGLHPDMISLMPINGSIK